MIRLTANRRSEKIPFYVTDGLDFYKVVFLNHYGVHIEYPETGKRGRPRNPRIVPPGFEIRLEVKTKKEIKLKKVKKKVIFGEDIEESTISTSLIERQNLTFRQDNNRVSRKTKDSLN